MPNCSKYCKHYYLGFCTKYQDFIGVSKNYFHYGLLMHPLEFLTLYYDYERKDIELLIEKAEKFLTDDISKSICNYYRKRGYITFKQRKLLLHQFFHCYEEKEKHYGDIIFCQVE